MFLIERDTQLTRVTLSPLLNPHSLLTSLDYSTGFGALFVHLSMQEHPGVSCPQTRGLWGALHC